MQNFSVNPRGCGITDFTHHDNFISEYETDIDCQPILEYYDYISKCGIIVDRSNIHRSTDSQVFIHELPGQFWHDNLSRSVYSQYNSLTDQALRGYCTKYNILLDKQFQHTLCKLQKTEPMQGFHGWHYENTSNTPFRQLVTMLYLNDDYEAGETEFLYQSFRVKPKAGKFVIFPAGWSWTHRGNPPINGDKYILTSWVEEYPNNQTRY